MLHIRCRKLIVTIGPSRVPTLYPFANPEVEEHGTVELVSTNWALVLCGVVSE